MTANEVSQCTIDTKNFWFIVVLFSRFDMSTRQIVQEPKTQSDWDNLPLEFTEFLDSLDAAREAAASKKIVDPLYPSYDYNWETDSEIPFSIALDYWNSSTELPDVNLIIEEINEALVEAAYDNYCSSFYSY